MNDEMQVSTEPPIRINAKQTAKGDWYFEATARGETVEECVALLDDAISKAESTFVSSGRNVAGK